LFRRFYKRQMPVFPGPSSLHEPFPCGRLCSRW
jgi:hypothetical protein